MMFVYTTCADMDEAKRIAKLLIDHKTAACVQFWEVGSMYTWKGEFKAVREVALLMKTFEPKLPEIEELISANHSYSTFWRCISQRQKIGNRFGRVNPIGRQRRKKANMQ